MNGQLVSSPASQRGAAGLDSAGLDSAGLDSAGLDSAGLDSAGLDSAGLDSALWEFPFRSGRLCLDFAATLGSRGQMNLERLQVPGDLERWLTQAGLGARGPVSEADLADAVRLREAIHGLVLLEPGRRLPGAAGVVNQMAAPAPLVPRLDEAGRASAWSPGGTVTQALSSVARDAIGLLSGPLITRVRSCAGPDCTILFVDTSRPGTRRWCSMEACGNQAKSAGLRQQRRQARLAASQPTPDPGASR